jgi:hypothetical protein
MQRIAFVAVAAGLGAVCGCGDDSPNADGSSACRYDTGPPLTHHLEQPERVILARARRILRHAATSDRRSGLVQVLAGSRYREEAIGTWEPSSHAGVIGATIEIALDRPRPVDAVVSSAGEAWPRSSPNYRYSRRYGYVEWRSRLVSRSLTGLALSVDLRRGRVVDIDPAVSGSGTATPLPGHCPIPQPPPGYD